MSIIQVNNLTFGYEGSIENVFENVTFNLDNSSLNTFKATEQENK